MKDYIKIEDCIDGNLYTLDARNSTVGIYDKSRYCFVISRLKFRENFISHEYHYDIGTISSEMEEYGTAKPLRDLGRPELSIAAKDEYLLMYLNMKESMLRNGDL